MAAPEPFFKGAGSKLTRADIDAQAAKSDFLFLRPPTKKRGKTAVPGKFKRVYAVLGGAALFSFKDEKARRFDFAIELREHSIRSGGLGAGDGEGKFGFDLVPNNGAYDSWGFYVESFEDRADWVAALGNAKTGQGTTKEIIEMEERLRRNQYDIPPADLEWGDDDTLGKGASGIVKRGKWLKSVDVAVKALNNLPEFTDPDEMMQFYREIEMLTVLRHPHIVAMFGFCKKDGYLCLVTEFVTGGDLSRYIKDQSLFIETELKVNLLLTTAKGMVFLHNKGVIHRDLKPGNILVDDFETGKVKVCDFGLSSQRMAGAVGDSVQDTYGSPAYAAPELPQANHTDKVDVFSFAVIAWEVMTRQPLWQMCERGSDILERVLNGERMKLTPGCPLNPLISRCWQPVPEARPRFSDVHEEVERVWEQLSSGQIEWRNPSEPGSAAGASQVQRGIGGVPSPHLSRNAGSPHMARTTTPPRPNVPVAPVSARPAYGSQPGMGASGAHIASLQPFYHSTATVGISGPGTHVCEQATLRAFGHRATLPWKDFSDALLQAYRCDDVAEVDGQQFSPDVERFRFVLEKPPGSNQIERSLWLEFSRWFSPLLIPGDTSGNVEDTRPSIKQISQIVGHSWFFGFMTAPEARDSLQRENKGTYLFRLSSTAGCYALSVNYGQVGHWRITTERRVLPGSGTPPQQIVVYKIDDREYSSLLHIVETHQSGGIPLEVKQAGFSSTFLHMPLLRREPDIFAGDDDSIYGEYVHRG